MNIIPLSGHMSSPYGALTLNLDWCWHVETEFDAGKGGEMMWWGTVHCQSELRAALRCIPSAHLQPKHLMSSESAERTDHFHSNNVLSICHSPLPTPLVLLFLSLCCPSLGSFMWGQEWRFSSTPDPTQVHCAAVRQPSHSHLKVLG